MKKIPSCLLRCNFTPSASFSMCASMNVQIDPASIQIPSTTRLQLHGIVHTCMPLTLLIKPLLVLCSDGYCGTQWQVVIYE